MPRGGKRPGAGRKPRLSRLDKLRVGARCERLWREVYRANAEAALRRQLPETRRQWRKAQDVPVPDRPAWTASPDFEDHQDDVRGGLQEDQGIDLVGDDREPARIIRAEPVRPKVGPQIVARVASETGETERMVERCWKLFRKIERESD